jgi:hypothetical protein
MRLGELRGGREDGVTVTVLDPDREDRVLHVLVKARVDGERSAA